MALTKIDDRGLKTPIDLLDNEKIRLGTGNDLEIYHNGTDSIIKDAGTGSLSLLGSAVFLQNAAQTETFLSGVTDSSVSIYYDNSKKLETTSTGVTIYPALKVDSGSIETYMSYSNGNSTGIIGTESNHSLEVRTNNTERFRVDTSGNIDFNDSVKTRWGTGNDLTLEHNGTQSEIINSTGDLLIQCTGDDLNLKAADDVNIKVQGGVENAIIAYGDGGVELYYDNAKKLETTSSGIGVTGTVASVSTNDLKLSTADSGADIQFQLNGTTVMTLQNTSKLEVNDNFEMVWGNGSDLRIKHDGSNTQIINATGELQNFADTWRVVSNSGSNENMIRATYDAGVELFHNDSKKLETYADGVYVYDYLFLHDNDKLICGHGSDLQIYHDGSNSYIHDSGTGGLRLRGNEINAVNEANSEWIWRAFEDGAVELYYDGTKKFETLSTGWGVANTIEWHSTQGSLDLYDNKKVSFGGSRDLQIYHDGTDSFVKDGSAHLVMLTDAFRVNNNANSENMIVADANAAVKLYYNDSQKFATTTWGAQPNGDVIPNGDDTHDLGASNERWDNIYASSGSVSTSDRNEKNTIVDSDLGLSFVNKLKPVSYKFNGKTRTHYGLIAQDIETTLSDISKSTANFAGFIKTDNPEVKYEDWDILPEGKNIGDVRIAAKTTYGLRYEEFIAPLIKAVQELSTEVETLKTKVAALEAA